MPTNPLKRYKITIYLLTQSLPHVSTNVQQHQGDESTNEFTYFIYTYIYIYL